MPSNHPLTPPHCAEAYFDWLRLLRSRRVGPATFFRMMREHGTARDALAALPDVARAAGVTDYSPCPTGVIDAELKAARKAGATLLAFGDEHYPAALMDLDDAPPMLWALGDLSLLKRPMIALVGARNASSLGLRMARALARELGKEGFVTVSGLARGIDAQVHQATLDSGTVAVLAGGVDVVYPAENAVLAQDIAKKGLRLSEHPMGMKPFARHFPMRNRIVSGLGRAVVVIEAASGSGSLITARTALDQGRDVMAVPGHPFDGRAAGCNMLLRDGATLVRGARDVIEALPADEGPTPSGQLDLALSPPRETRSLADHAALHREILARLGPSPLAEDQLIRDLALPAEAIAPQLLALELEGRIARHSGGLLALA
ncbi:DNA-processing protein DprA [Aquimixticola soesokkakensis]|uniref:DNA-processing protein DprA n=1 Tax=Aquimixticola soesokkakensis TaxID=1519096 RepID=UPI00352173F7